MTLFRIVVFKSLANCYIDIVLVVRGNIFIVNKYLLNVMPFQWSLLYWLRFSPL